MVRADESEFRRTQPSGTASTVYPTGWEPV
jgi:hypothetical protein